MEKILEWKAVSETVSFPSIFALTAKNIEEAIQFGFDYVADQSIAGHEPFFTKGFYEIPEAATIISSDYKIAAFIVFQYNPQDGKNHRKEAIFVVKELERGQYVVGLMKYKEYKNQLKGNLDACYQLVKMDKDQKLWYAEHDSITTTAILEYADLSEFLKEHLERNPF